MPLVRRMTIIGVGLIGGSLARVLREKGVVGEIVGVGRGAANLQRAVELGVIDRYSHDPRQGVAGADLVFLSLPVCSIAGMVAQIASSLAPGAVVTDGGSVKAQVVADCESLMPPGSHFVGGHPIAGTEHSGVEASFASLYRGKRCIITPSERTDPGALALVEAVWRAADAQVVLMDPHKHDRVVAAISHLPHMVAYSLVNAVDGYDRYDENILTYSAGGFRDFTRIASSNPAMWRDIALMNREALLEMMDVFSRHLEHLRSLVAAGNADGLEGYFRQSKECRDAIVECVPDHRVKESA